MSRGGWLALVLLTAGCGAPTPEADDPPAEAGSSATESDATGEPSPSPTRSAARATGTELTVAASPFGQMLFDRRGQAIYLFEPEADGRPECYGACEAAWPPVLTQGRPVAGEGLRPVLLGTVERRDGTSQVTYGGWPLYFYAHEDPGQVLCHDVVLNGGLWLAVGPEGEPLPT